MRKWDEACGDQMFEPRARGMFPAVVFRDLAVT
jgi:hypothetical protein